MGKRIKEVKERKEDVTGLGDWGRVKGQKNKRGKREKRGGRFMYTIAMLQRALAIIDETIDLAIRIHRDLGASLLESSYEQILSSLLRRGGHSVVNELPVRFVYDGILVENNYRLDLFVDDILVIELKAVEMVMPVHYKQALTYTKILNHPIGLLLNFGGDTIHGHFSRIINTSHPLAQALSDMKGFRG